MTFINLQSLGISGMLLILIVVSMVINLILSLMITFRLLSHERQTKAILGMRKGPSPFKKVMAMCVESCVLIIIGGMLCVATTVVQLSSAIRSIGLLDTSPGLDASIDKVSFVDLAYIALALLPHICVSFTCNSTSSRTYPDIF